MTVAVVPKTMDCDAGRLTRLVGERRPIYDFTIKEHNNRELIDALWEEIAMLLNTTVAHCKAKWCNIRNCYSRYLRTTKNFPSPITGRKKKKWYLADNLTFLDPFMSQTRKQEQTFEEIPLEVVHDLKEDPESSDSQNIQSFPMVVTEFKSEDETYEPPKKRYLKHNYLADSHYPKIREEADPDLDFFKCLLPDLKKLQPRRQRKFKEVMLSTLHRCLDEEEEEQSARPKIGRQTRNVEVAHANEGDVPSPLESPTPANSDTD